MKNVNLKKEKTIAVASGFSALLLVLILLSSFIKTDEHASLKTSSDEEVFKTVMFARGTEDVLQQLPSLDNYAAQRYSALNQISLDAIRKIQDMVVAKIESTSPSYFRDFRSSLRTKDPYIIHNAMQNADKVIADGEKKIGYDFNPTNPDAGLARIVSAVVFGKKNLSKGKSALGNDFNYYNYSGSTEALVTDSTTNPGCLVDCCAIVTGGNESMSNFGLGSEKIAKEIAKIDF